MLDIQSSQRNSHDLCIVVHCHRVLCPTNGLFVALAVWYKDAFDVMLRSACHLDPKLNPESAVSSLFAARLYLIDSRPRIMDPVLFDSFCVFVFQFCFQLFEIQFLTVYQWYIYIYTCCMLQHNSIMSFSMIIQIKFDTSTGSPWTTLPGVLANNDWLLFGVASYDGSFKTSLCSANRSAA